VLSFRFTSIVDGDFTPIGQSIGVVALLPAAGAVEETKRLLPTAKMR
jgi:hypothetical protein